jgi:hypothetical protein
LEFRSQQDRKVHDYFGRNWFSSICFALLKGGVAKLRGPEMINTWISSMAGPQGDTDLKVGRHEVMQFSYYPGRKDNGNHWSMCWGFASICSSEKLVCLKWSTPKSACELSFSYHLMAIDLGYTPFSDTPILDIWIDVVYTSYISNYTILYHVLHLLISYEFPRCSTLPGPDYQQVGVTSATHGHHKT